MSECPVCRERKIEEDKLEAERKEAIAVKDKNCEMMKKWRLYIQGLPPYLRFSFEVLENNLGAMWADADTETEEQARAKLEKYIEDNGGGITLGKLRYSEPRSKHLMERNFLEDKDHLEKAGIPEYKRPEIGILYGRSQG
jgi:hypothetical protein